MTQIKIKCKPCMFCGKVNEVTVNALHYSAWYHGEFIQKAMPELTVDEREMLISGTCSKCWDENMNFDDND